MKVTPVNKPFGKYKVGEVFEFPSKAAKVYIKLGKLAEVTGTYQAKIVEPAAVEAVETLVQEAETERDLVEISPRTGLPKRVYRRRDMESE